MRLVCPNCDAQYEVDANAVPEAGRDVQCSNCGHTWFQVPPDVEAELDADRALYGRIKNQLTDQPDAADAATQAVSEPDEPTRMSPKRVQAEAARTPAPAEKPAE